MIPAAPVEAKVKWSSIWAYIGATLAMFVVELVSSDPVIVTPMPDVVEPFVLALAPALLGLLAGIRTKHTPRPDLPIGDRPGQR